MNDQLLIEQAYRKIYENKSVLIPRRSKEERQKNYQIALYKQVQQYMKDGGKGDLDLINKPINSLPIDLKVGGDLILFGTPITSLPEGLEVNGNLNLRSSKIREIPKDIKISRSLFLSFTPITSLPEGLKINGDLYLKGSHITSLPKGLTVGGNLYLSNTPISRKFNVKELKQMLPNVKGEIYK